MYMVKKTDICYLYMEYFKKVMFGVARDDYEK